MEQICICNALPDLAHVPMGGDGLDEKLLATLREVKAFGEAKYWLYLGKCSACRQDWLVAQEERIFDEHFLKRLSSEQASRIVNANEWPEYFWTYENVLKIGSTMSSHCRFFERTAPSLVWTAEDLMAERPEITLPEIAALLGVRIDQATDIVNAVGK